MLSMKSESPPSEGASMFLQTSLMKQLLLTGKAGASMHALARMKGALLCSEFLQPHLTREEQHLDICGEMQTPIGRHKHHMQPVNCMWTALPGGKDIHTTSLELSSVRACFLVVWRGLKLITTAACVLRFQLTFTADAISIKACF